MSSLDKARETQLANIQKRTGKSFTELKALIDNSGLTKHGEIRQMLISQFGLGFGDASMLVHFAQESDGQTAAQAKGASIDDVVGEIYSGPRSPLRPIHDALIKAITGLGEFEIVPKKGYVSLRRKRQFAMIGPGTKGRVELGLNMKDIPASERLLLQPPGGMCQYKVYLVSPDEVDQELQGWLHFAYDHAG